MHTRCHYQSEVHYQHKGRGSSGGKPLPPCCISHHCNFVYTLLCSLAEDYYIFMHCFITTGSYLYTVHHFQFICSAIILELIIYTLFYYYSVVSLCYHCYDQLQLQFRIVIFMQSYHFVVQLLLHYCSLLYLIYLLSLSLTAHFYLLSNILLFIFMVNIYSFLIFADEVFSLLVIRSVIVHSIRKLGSRMSCPVDSQIFMQYFIIAIISAATINLL